MMNEPLVETENNECTALPKEEQDISLRRGWVHQKTAGYFIAVVALGSVFWFLADDTFIAGLMKSPGPGKERIAGEVFLLSVGSAIGLCVWYCSKVFWRRRAITPDLGAVAGISFVLAVFLVAQPLAEQSRKHRLRQQEATEQMQARQFLDQVRLLQPTIRRQKHPAGSLQRLEFHATIENHSVAQLRDLSLKISFRAENTLVATEPLTIYDTVEADGLRAVSKNFYVSGLPETFRWSYKIQEATFVKDRNLFFAHPTPALTIPQLEHDFKQDGGVPSP